MSEAESGAAEAVVERDERGRFTSAPPWAWKKGQSGNPGGRPSGASITAAILRALARNPDEDGIGDAAGKIGEYLVKALHSMEPDKAAALLRAVLDRVEGPVVAKSEVAVRSEARAIHVVSTSSEVPALPASVRELERRRLAADETAKRERAAALRQGEPATQV